MAENVDAYEDNPEFQKVVDQYNNILTLLLQTLNEIMDAGSEQSESEGGFFDELQERPELMMDEYTQTQVEG